MFDVAETSCGIMTLSDVLEMLRVTPAHADSRLGFSRWRFGPVLRLSIPFAFMCQRRMLHANRCRTDGTETEVDFHSRFRPAVQQQADPETLSGTAMPLLSTLLWTLDVWWAMMPVRANFPSPAIAVAVCHSCGGMSCLVDRILMSCG
jgi:hypothetical protein